MKETDHRGVDAGAITGAMCVKILRKRLEPNLTRLVRVDMRVCKLALRPVADWIRRTVVREMVLG